jgi:hypothetical protein
MNGYGCNHPEVKQNPQLYAPYNEKLFLMCYCET